MVTILPLRSTRSAGWAERTAAARAARTKARIKLRILAARGNNRVGRVASAAGAKARSGDDCNAGHFRGAATKLLAGAAATLWAAMLWPDSFVARRRR